MVLLPLDALKVKAQTSPEQLHGRGVVDIFAKEGFGLYRGAGLTAMRNAPGMCLNRYAVTQSLEVTNNYDTTVLTLSPQEVLHYLAAILQQRLSWVSERMDAVPLGHKMLSLHA